MKKDEIKGMVEVWGEVRGCQILKMDDGSYSVYLDNDLYDGSTFEEFVEECGNKIYNSLADYKKDKFKKII